MLKKNFIVAYEYGSGAVWGTILARNSDEIIARFPDLKIFEVAPTWALSAVGEEIFRRNHFDIDDVEVPKWAGTDKLSHRG